MDLIPTHHTNEIAQSVACSRTQPVKYWMHANMLTVNGVRMSKSAGNGFLPKELFTGSHPLLARGYSPMVVRFFMMQTHYRSTLDFSNEALQASEKGFEKLMNAVKTLEKLKPADRSTSDIRTLRQKCFDAMNDDFNSPVLVASLFEGVRIVNSVHAGTETISKEDITVLKQLFSDFVFDVLGLKEDKVSATGDELAAHLMNLIIELRKEARAKKDFEASDKIRDTLAKMKISLKDTKEGVTWNMEK